MRAEHYLIGDLRTAALVSSKGSIDWLCLPDFDSSSVFGSVLDEHAGVFRPVHDGCEVSSRYEDDTAIVETTLQKGDERTVIRDFMVPLPHDHPMPQLLVRQVEGSAVFLFDPRPDYARSKHIVRREGNRLSIPVGELTLSLHLPEGSGARETERGWEIALQARNEPQQLVLELASAPGSFRREDLLAQTRNFWRAWVAQGRFFEPRDELVRSAITLKLLQYYPTGAIVAAPTTSLPEVIGGERNWDYRYVWIRDATFTLYAFYILGYMDELLRFFQFIERTVQDGDLELLYTIRGEPAPAEEVLDHLAGHKGSRPVRVGNDASAQFQLDVYGSLIDAYYFLSRRGLEISREGKSLIRRLVRTIERRWQEKDNGIWEVRHELQHFTYGKVMAWVGTNRAIRMHELLGATAEEVGRWRALEDSIRSWVQEHCADGQTYLQYPGARAQDATNLLFVLLQFLDRHDPATKLVIRRTCEELQEGAFVYRYRNPDGLPGREGAFILCTFWLVAALAAVGDIEEAKAILAELSNATGRSNLMAEEIDPETREQLGNYPQAFSHMGLILAAHYLQRYGDES